LRNAETFEEIEAYPYPCNKGWLDDELRATVAKEHAAGNPVTGYIGHMYESAWEVRGYEPFLIDLMTNRDWAEFILDKFYENNMRNAVAAAKAGVDVLQTGDDVANQNSMMFQVDLWRDVMKSRWAKVYAAAKEIKPDIKIWYHSDGNIEAIVDDLIEIGVDILNPVQPECLDPIALRKRYGKNLAFDGCMGTQSTFPFGTAAEVRAKVLEWGNGLDGINGGLTLSPTHVLEPEVPPENVVAFFEACDEL
jgi:uroporphyrinogen decarboxylase